jgi:hypothetical protein
MHTPMRSLMLTFVFAAGLAAQGEDPKKPDPKKPDPKVAETIKELKAAVSDRQMAKDVEAIGLIDTLLKDFENYVEKDQRDIVNALADVYRSRQRPPDQIGLYEAAAVALGRMGKDGGTALLRAYNEDKIGKRDYVRVRAVILRNLGKVQDESHAKFLTDRAVRDPEDEIMAAAGEALGNYDAAKQNVRKQIFETLLRKFMEVESGAKANLDPGDAQVKSHKDTLTRISDPWNTTMARLTGQTHRTAEDWNRWWNKTGKSSKWDK